MDGKREPPSTNWKRLEGAQQKPSFVISPPATSIQLIPTGNGNRNTNYVIPTSAKEECYILNIEISQLYPPPANLFRESPQNSKSSFGYSFSGLLLWKVGPCSHLGSQRWRVGLGPQILIGAGPYIFDQISKITPISDLLSYKGCLSAMRPRTFCSKRKKGKKLLL